MAKSLSQRAQEWWTRQGYDKNHPLYSKEQAKAISEYSLPREYPDEWEAEQAEPTPSIPFTVYPTRTSNATRPRTIAAGYDRGSQTLRIQFRSPNWRVGHQWDDGAGAVYDYHDVTPNEWKDIRRVVSTGKFINRRLENKDFTRLS
jgi:hypothetical protein